VSTPLLYRFGRVLVGIAARAYFREIDVQRADRMPPQSPVILAANHPQSVTDALILGLATSRVVHFVAHSGLFRNPLVAAGLRSAGVIAIHRGTDVPDASLHNESSFAACTEVLRRGGCIGIFPEGTSQQARQVQPLKTGTARIALEAESESGFRLGLEIVPVGLSFQSRRRFRSRVLVYFGRPIVVSEWKDAFESDPREAARSITARLQEAIRHQVVDVARSELEEFVSDVERVYKQELRERPDLDVPGLSRFERDQLLAREIARAADYFYRKQPERIWGIAELLREYDRRLRRLGIPDRMIREEGPGFAATAMRLGVLAVAGFVPAAWGLVTSYVPWWLTGLVVGWRRPDDTKWHWNQIGIGGAFFAAFYFAYLWVAYHRLGGWTTMAIGISLPLCGLFARWYVVKLAGHRKHLRLAWLTGTRGLMLQRIRAYRREVIDVMDEALEEYLARDETGETGGTAT
jgi:glycerol-3-phosphate O-acyltransferase/dihydroxyacetone phosphate acyltransferase